MSRPGSRRIPTMPSGCNRGARWRMRCMRATIPSPTKRCRSGSRSSGWCGSRANGSMARSPRRWWPSSPAAASAGWRAARPPRHRRSRISRLDALDAHRLYVVEVRHPVEVPGSERTHLQQWLTKRCGWDVRAPELAATGLKLVGGRLLPGPTGPASFLMYESASGERFTVYTAQAPTTETTQMRYAAAGQRRRAVLGRPRRRLCAQRPHRPGAADQVARRSTTRRKRPADEVIRNDVRIPTSKICEFRHRKSGIKTSVRLNIRTGCSRENEERSIRRSAQAASIGVCTALVPRSRLHLFG